MQKYRAERSTIEPKTDRFPTRGKYREVYLASDVRALLKALKKELDDDDLALARKMVDNALMGG